MIGARAPDTIENFAESVFVFDRKGKTVQVFYGAPPDLHERVASAIAAASSSRT